MILYQIAQLRSDDKYFKGGKNTWTDVGYYNASLTSIGFGDIHSETPPRTCVCFYIAWVVSS